MGHSFLYIDPGNGSYLVQMIIAAVLGASFFFKNVWFKIKSFFSKNKNKPDSNNELDAGNDSETV